MRCIKVIYFFTSSIDSWPEYSELDLAATEPEAKELTEAGVDEP